MSLAELPLTQGYMQGIETERRPSRWMEDFKVEDDGVVGPCVKEVEEAAPPPVASKDLFREAANLPNNDRFQMNVGRFLLYLRHREISHRLRSTRSSVKKAETEKPSAESAKRPVREITTDLLEMLEKAVQGSTDPIILGTSQTDNLAALVKALKTLRTHFEATVQTETVLESFEGYVDEVDCDTAYVTLQSVEHGDVLHGKYSASELLKKGIEEQSRFLCRTIKANGATRVDLQPLPDAEVTDEEVRAISEEMDRAFSSDDSAIRF
jgi:hypothetical protein